MMTIRPAAGDDWRRIGELSELLVRAHHAYDPSRFIPVDMLRAEVYTHAGIGAALVASAIEWFDARGVARIMLWTAPQNAQAQRLFHRAGFRQTMIEMTLDRR